MSGVSDALRERVVDRAAGSCEYCQLPSEGQVGRFPVDHIVPRTEGGVTEPENLTLACHHCNAHEWAHRTGLDPESGDVVPLYHPRRQSWAEHFAWSTNPPHLIVGTTPTGRATVERLQMNGPDMLTARRLLASLGMFPPRPE